MSGIISRLKKYFDHVYETNPNEFSDQQGASDNTYNRLLEFAYQQISSEADENDQLSQSVLDELETFIENDTSSMSDATSHALEQWKERTGYEE